MDLGERVEWVKARCGDQSGDLQEVWTPVVAVNLPEVKDGPSVFFRQAALVFPGLPFSACFPLPDHVSC